MSGANSLVAVCLTVFASLSVPAFADTQPDPAPEQAPRKLASLLLPDENVASVSVNCYMLPTYLYVTNKNGTGQAYFFKDWSSCVDGRRVISMAGTRGSSGRQNSVEVNLDLDKSAVVSVELKN